MENREEPPAVRQAQEWKDEDFTWVAAVTELVVQYLRRRPSEVGEVDAEILAEQALDRLIRYRPDLVGSNGGRRMVFTIVRNLRRNWLDASGGRPILELPAGLADPKNAVSDMLTSIQDGRDGDLFRERFLHVLRMMSSRAERAVLDRLLEGVKDNREIASDCGLSVPSVRRVRLSLWQKRDVALQLAARNFEREEVVSSEPSSPRALAASGRSRSARPTSTFSTKRGPTDDTVFGRRDVRVHCDASCSACVFRRRGIPTTPIGGSDARRGSARSMPMQQRSRRRLDAGRLQELSAARYVHSHLAIEREHHPQTRCVQEAGSPGLRC